MSIAMTITNDGRALFRNGTDGADNPLISYVALGTSSTTPTVNDHTLGHETYRKAVTSYTNGSAPGEVLVDMFLGDNDAVGLTTLEVGVFGGKTATSSANTGVLVAHGLYTMSSKTNLQSFLFQFDLTFS